MHSKPHRWCNGYCQHLNTILNSQYKHSHETVNTLIQSWTVNTRTHMKLLPHQCNHEQSMQALTWNCQHLNTILNSQYKHSHETVNNLIQSWTVNTELTWNSHHLNTILNSQYKHSHETVNTLIQSWRVNTRTHMKLTTP
jgi:cell fate (sporulation/competence/biofilm development) regulator YmcA (YheA/YmcA/DUF963 family)